LLNTTHHHVEEYESELREAERKGTPRRRAIKFMFSLLTFDVEMRFEQTIGTAKALVAIAKATPRTGTKAAQTVKKEIATLFDRIHSDVYFLDARFADQDLRKVPVEKVCTRLIERFGNTLNRCNALKTAIDALPETMELYPLKFAGAAVLARVALDYELLVEQFHDFMQGDEHRAEQPLAEAA